jgi:hypothetical protein
MNEDILKLRKFSRIHRNLAEIEELYEDLEEYEIARSSSFFLDAYLALNAHIEATVDVANLSDKKIVAYAELNKNIFDRLKKDPFRLYAVAGNISDIFAEGYRIAEASIAKELSKYPEDKRPFFSCGFAFFELHIPEHTLLETLLIEDHVSLDHFRYHKGRVDIDIADLNKKFHLTGQEHELFGKAYSECMRHLNDKLHLCGKVTYHID